MKRDTFFPDTVLISLFFLLAVSGMTGSAAAAEYILGRVVELDRARQELGVQVEEYSAAGRPLALSSGQRTGVRLPESVWQVMPACLQEGETVRLWGEYDSLNQVFAAEEIRGTRGWQGGDRSGVRSRLGRGRGFGWGGPMNGRGPGYGRGGGSGLSETGTK